MLLSNVFFILNDLFPFQEVKKSLCHVFIQCRGYIWIRSLKKNRIRNPALKYQIKPNGIPVWFLSTNIVAYFRTTHSLVVELLSWKAHRQLNKKNISVLSVPVTRTARFIWCKFTFCSETHLPPYHWWGGSISCYINLLVRRYFT